MKITITLQDTEDGKVEIEENRLPHPGENIETMTVATALADEIKKYIDSLGETTLSLK